MSVHKLNFKPAIGELSPDAIASFEKIAMACDEHTAHPEIATEYPYLMQQIKTFGSCTVATALFIADRKRRGETWWPVLVEDNEFPQGHPLDKHWIATNGTINVDLTVADREEKEVRTLGSDAERTIVASYQSNEADLKRLRAGLDRYNAQAGIDPLNLSADELLEMVYVPLLQQPSKPSNTIRVTTMMRFIPRG